MGFCTSKHIAGSQCLFKRTNLKFVNNCGDFAAYEAISYFLLLKYFVAIQDKIFLILIVIAVGYKLQKIE